MASPTVDALVNLAQQLSEEEQEELIRRLDILHVPSQPPSKTLKVFHVDQIADNVTLRREDEYGDDDR